MGLHNRKAICVYNTNHMLTVHMQTEMQTVKKDVHWQEGRTVIGTGNLWDKH